MAHPTRLIVTPRTRSRKYLDYLCGGNAGGVQASAGERRRGDNPAEVDEVFGARSGASALLEIELGGRAEHHDAREGRVFVSSVGGGEPSAPGSIAA